MFAKILTENNIYLCQAGESYASCNFDVKVVTFTNFYIIAVCFIPLI